MLCLDQHVSTYITAQGLVSVLLLLIQLCMLSSTFTTTKKREAEIWYQDEKYWEW